MTVGKEVLAEKGAREQAAKSLVTAVLLRRNEPRSAAAPCSEALRLGAAMAETQKCSSFGAETEPDARKCRKCLITFM